MKPHCNAVFCVIHTPIHIFLVDNFSIHPGNLKTFKHLQIGKKNKIVNVPPKSLLRETAIFYVH